MLGFTKQVNRSYWKVAGIIDAEECDERRIGEILDLLAEKDVQEEEQASRNYLQLAEDSNYECDDNFQGDIDFAVAQMTEIQIDPPEIQIDPPKGPVKLRQSQITNFFSKK